MLLLAAAGAALVWANSPWSSAYRTVSEFAIGPDPVITALHPCADEYTLLRPSTKRTRHPCRGPEREVIRFEFAAAHQSLELKTMRMTVKSLNHAKAVMWAVVAGAALSPVAAPTAAASDEILPRPGDGPADVAIQQLQSAGYNVSINWLEGYPNVPLRECKVTGISGLSGSTRPTDVMMMLTEPAEFETVYVDVSCPNAK